MIQENQIEVRVVALERLVSDLWGRLVAAERRAAAAEQQIAQSYTSPYLLPSGGSVGYPAVAGAGGIAARAGITPGSASVTLQTLGGGTLANGATVTAYNTLATAVGASKNLILIKDENGNYLVNAGDC